jgi:curved DNA-binding protein
MDYYEILGVGPEATAQDIKKAFRQIARECHPDVTGDDPVAAERFKSARKAYETLIDPVTRSRYDRRGERRKFEKGSFFDAFYRSTGDRAEGKGARPKSGPTYGHDAGGSPGAGRRARNNPGNDLDLEDLFNGFGDFGFSNAGASGGKNPSGSRGAGPTVSGGSPQPGADVEIDLEVPWETAREGGTVTAVYHRLQRADHWRPGSPDPGVVRIQDIADVRLLPNTRDGEVLRERGLGDAGEHGGIYGDLLVRVRVVQPRRPDPQPRRDATPTEPPPRSHAPPPKPPREEEPPRADGTTEEKPLDISVVEALLGGRVEIDTPQGKVRITLPPGTSSGKRMRLKGKGTDGADLYVVTRIVVPSQLDEPSRRLIEEFARLNPGSPRE